MEDLKEYRRSERVQKVEKSIEDVKEYSGATNTTRFRGGPRPLGRCSVSNRRERLRRGCNEVKCRNIAQRLLSSAEERVRLQKLRAEGLGPAFKLLEAGLGGGFWRRANAEYGAYRLTA